MHNFFKHQVQNLEDCLKLLDFPEFQLKLNSAIQLISYALASNKPVLVCGNGGSAADSQHIAGELVGKFLKERRALNVRALNTDTSVITAWANDVSYDTVFARQVEAYAQAGGVLWAISTSGNSKNVILAANKAKALGMRVVALTGDGGGALAKIADVLLEVPSKITPRIQEMHVMIYHYLCEAVESNFLEKV
jgi:D-sedoheptulose 7-phosphate isomerase